MRTTLTAFNIRPALHDSFASFIQAEDRLGLAVLPVDDGFICRAGGRDELALFTESQLFGGRSRPKAERAARERDPESIIRNLTDLSAGAPVVHEDHGVGRYQGLETLDIDDRHAEFLMLEYAWRRQALRARYPRCTWSAATPAVTRKMPRCTGSAAASGKRPNARPPNRSATSQPNCWTCTPGARPARALPFRWTESCTPSSASAFPFEETPDQQSAIEAVISDLESQRPMDRVVCGDVGFGKTEVALRAAFVAVQAGRQVALLVPTTLLAQQHFSTFSDRLADWPVRVELLSRFRTGKQAEQVIGKLRDGGVDIVIGTHRLIQKDIRFKQLGLVIIDEEQRFGVQAERAPQATARRG